MDNSNSKLKALRTALSLALLLAITLLPSVSAYSHEVIGIDGKPTHKHVYKKAPNGNGVIMGHAARPPGSNGIVIWQAAPEPAYNRAQLGMSIPRDPWSKKRKKLAHSADKKQMQKPEPVFSKQQSRTPNLDPR